MKILIAEDNARLQKLYKTVLHEHDLIVVDNAADAVTALESDNSIEAVLSDYELIGSTGDEIYAWVSQHRPDMKFVLVTGYRGDLALAQRVTTLLKPFRLKDLQKLFPSST